MAGTVVISPEGVRDGETMLEATDADGAAYVQQMVEKATALQPGEQATCATSTPRPARRRCGSRTTPRGTG